MSWILATLFSACALGGYDVAKKHAVNQNAVMPVLFLATLTGTTAFVLYTLAIGNATVITAGSAADYGLVALKSAIVAGSWICVYAAMQTMPISLAAPIRATAPLWTFLVALPLYHEVPTVGRAIGMLTVFIGYYLFAVWGKLEGFRWNGRGMVLIMLGTLLGAGSALYDKYLLNTLHINREFVQFHFSVDLVVIFGLITLLKRSRVPFKWRWTIPVTGVLLIVADALYFYAVSCPDIHISILSLMRRTSVIIAFALGCLLFHEQNVKRKSLSLALILIGTVLLTLF